MQSHVKKIALFFLVIFLTMFSVDSKGASSTKEQIEELKQQIEEIKTQNQQQIDALQRKIEQLEVERAADKEQIEKVVAEDKDAWYKKFKAGYKKGFFLESDDGNFSMRMRLRTQIQFSVNNTDDKETGEDETATDFNIRRFRIKWDGHAFRPWFNYVAQIAGDNNGNFQLRDAYFDAAYDTRIFPRVGQNKVPFNREELTSSSALQLVERSIVNAEFAYGRDRGVGAYGLLANMFTYGIGIYNGDGRNGKSVDSNLLYAGRIQFNPCCGKLRYGSGSFPITGDYKLVPNFGGKEPILAFGGGFAALPGLNIAQKTPDGSIDDRFDELGLQFGDVYSVTADAQFKYQIFSISAEYDGRWIKPQGVNSVAVFPVSDLGTVYDQGFRVQGGIFIVPHLVELAARWAYIDYDTAEGLDPGERQRDKEWQVTPGINIYLSHDNRWKIQLDYNFIKSSFLTGADTNENIFRAQLQAYF